MIDTSAFGPFPSAMTKSTSLHGHYAISVHLLAVSVFMLPVLHSWDLSRLVYQSGENITGQIGTVSDAHSWNLSHLVDQMGRVILVRRWFCIRGTCRACKVNRDGPIYAMTAGAPRVRSVMNIGVI
jgi:hypothetical protein